MSHALRPTEGSYSITHFMQNNSDTHIMISVIIPCYNAEKYLERTFRCLDAQTYRNFEVICINDGSTDSTQQLLERLCAERKQCAVYSYENGGLSVARNRGIPLAKGDYIHFLDADDWFYPTMYERMVNMITKHDMPDAVRVGYKWTLSFDENDIPPLKDNGEEVVVCGDSIIEKITKKLLGQSTQDILDYYKTGRWEWKDMPAFVWEYLYKRDTIVKNNVCFVPRLQMIEDRIFNCTFLLYAEKVVYTDAPYYLYLSTSEGLLNTILNNPHKAYSGKIDNIVHRQAIRELYLKHKDFDLFSSYRGSNVLACFQTATILVNLPYREGKAMYLDFVNNPLIEESLDGFPTKGAPLKMKVPLFMLQHGMKGWFYDLVWIASKLGIRFNSL